MGSRVASADSAFTETLMFPPDFSILRRLVMELTGCCVSLYLYLKANDSDHIQVIYCPAVSDTRKSILPKDLQLVLVSAQLVCITVKFI